MCFNCILLHLLENAYFYVTSKMERWSSGVAPNNNSNSHRRITFNSPSEIFFSLLSQKDMC